MGFSCESRSPWLSYRMFVSPLVFYANLSAYTNMFIFCKKKKSLQFSLYFQRYLGSKRKDRLMNLKYNLTFHNAADTNHFSSMSNVKKEVQLYLKKANQIIWFSFYIEVQQFSACSLLPKPHFTNSLNLHCFLCSLQGREKETLTLCIDIAILLYFMSRIQVYKMKQVQLIPLLQMSRKCAYTWFLFSQILLLSRELHV